LEHKGENTFPDGTGDECEDTLEEEEDNLVDGLGQ